MVPIELTSALNCLSPCGIWHAWSSLFTAIVVESLRDPLNTEPKLPPPSLSMKFVVARCKSMYSNEIIPLQNWESFNLSPENLVLLRLTSSRISGSKHNKAKLAKIASPITIPLLSTPAL
ncbi:Os04g0420166 [Oryza sativa Japonica Group]|uniref:Os04g0420166 protein n=1 Tax=Oryza sativa subsp. japonica TaxID=39947 RepID=A0A0P0WA23_ORYSJ|nr:Os04g0420166 [Oryza sativa Japonica Group]